MEASVSASSERLGAFGLQGEVEQWTDVDPATITRPEESLSPALQEIINRNPGLSCDVDGRTDSVGDETSQRVVVLTRRLNEFSDLGPLVKSVGRALADGGLFAGVVETIAQRRERIRGEDPTLASRLRWSADFLLHRVVPRLSLTRGLYRRALADTNRAISLTESLGRLVHAGFEIVDVEHGARETGFLVRKVRDPLPDKSESLGILYSMNRVGRGGKPILVYKIRTMHPYAQYLQEYVYNGRSVAPGGKFKDDFRVTRWGRLLRRYWIDELPMVINWLKGDLKLVGVRPLSAQYLSLYPSDVRARRIRSKPGLIPPYYADLPNGFESIVESERQYLLSYERRPIRTDVAYLLRALSNILFRSARSA